VARKTGVNVIDILRAAFRSTDPKFEKQTVKSSVSFCAFATYMLKSCLYHVDEIDTRLGIDALDTRNVEETASFVFTLSDW
jgi:hypothetical protein